MVKNTKKRGDLAEDLACGYLLENGYKLVERNYRERWGEIDIIAINTDKIVTFIEVKSLSFNIDMGVDNSEIMGIIPEDHFNNIKREKVKRLAQFYINSNSELLKKGRGWQIDLIAVYLNQHKDIGNQIKHYPNVISDY